MENGEHFMKNVFFVIKACFVDFDAFSKIKGISMESRRRQLFFFFGKKAVFKDRLLFT